MEYLVPKEIKAKPKILGLEIKDIALFGLGVVLVFSVFNEHVHKMFIIPYYLVSSGVLFWAFIPSGNNPECRNYMSVVLFLRSNKNNYHALDVFKAENEKIENMRKE